MKSTKGGMIIKFIISKYCVPSKLFMDNDISFRDNEVRYFCNKYHINKKLFTPYYSQGNSQN